MFYILTQGADKPAGPYSLEALATQFNAGKLSPGTKVNKVGSDEWVPVQEVLKKATPSEATTSTKATSDKPQPLLIALVAVAGICSICLIACVVLLSKVFSVVDAHAKFTRESSAAVKSDTIAWRKRQAGVRLPLSKVTHECYAGNTEVSCYVTNLGKDPVVACMRGVLMQKESTGVRLYSTPMCSGPVAPLSSVRVQGYWTQGKANDLCRNSRGFLDFDKCTFNVINYDG